MMKTRSFYPGFAHVVASADWSRCEERIMRFEEAWLAGQTPSIEDYLLTGSNARKALLIELIHVDLEFQFKFRAPVFIERYLAAFPELAADSGALSDLVAAEYRLRKQQQERVDVAEYVQRFPSSSSHILERLALEGQDAAPAVRKDDEPTPGQWPDLPGYEILAQIGRGGMGVVYKARDPLLNRYVALKFLPSEYAHSTDRLDRFLREARTASALNHPHICTVHALGEVDVRPFIVMEFVEGETFQSLVKRHPSVDEVVHWIRQAARALAAAHAAGVVHRDIKPENLMVREDGYVKVLDFGLARRLPTLDAERADDESETNPGTLLGTVAYMSPEQTRGAAAETASDVFSLGIVTYQLLTGYHPFQSTTPIAMLSAIAASEAISPTRLNPLIPAALCGLVEAMLNKDPRLRPTAENVERTLAALAGDSSRITAVSPASHAILPREEELTALRAAFDKAEKGRGSFVCVAGEPGIGKTTLVEDFLSELTTMSASHWVARGDCSERLADTEAYLPVISALENLLRSDEDGFAARLMKVVAPSWYAQIVPGSSDGNDDLAAPSRASSQQAMLREFCNFLRDATRLRTAVLFFDDVHWADLATVDLLAHLGRHCQELRLLTIATFRQTEMLLGPHPFHSVKLELQGRGICTELALGFLDRQDCARYLELTFPNHDFPEDLADLVHARTEGSPLFMSELLHYLRERGFLSESTGRWCIARELPDLSRDLPQSVRGMIQRKLDRLGDEDRQLLSVASVIGHEFDSILVADALLREPADVEDQLNELDRVHGLVRMMRARDLPDRSLSIRYKFVHILYQQALYHDLLPTRRATFSLSLARAAERRYGESHPTVAAELACLYEVGRDFLRSARQYWFASQNAARIFAHREAIGLARRGIRLLDKMPSTPERFALELQLQTTLGLQHQVTDGYAAPAAREAYERARQLCSSSADSGKLLFPVLWGLWLYHKVRSDLRTAQRFATELFGLARDLNDPDLALQAHQALAMTAFCRGHDEAALRHVEQAAVLYDRIRHVTHALDFGQDPGVICKAFGAVVLWLLGYPDQARSQSQQAIQMSHELSPTSQAVALFFAAMVYQLRDEPAETQNCAERCTAIATEHGLSFWVAGSSVFRGWALAQQGVVNDGIDIVRQGLVDWQRTGSVTYRTYFLGMLAELMIRQGHLAESRRLLDEAIDLASETDERFYEPELYRLRGEVLRAGATESDQSTRSEADDCVRQALRLAQGRSAKSLEWRAAKSLGL